MLRRMIHGTRPLLTIQLWSTKKPAQIQPNRDETSQLADGRPNVILEDKSALRWPQLLLAVFLPFAFGYFLSYLFRVVNATAAQRLVAEFDLTAGQLGSLTAVYFLTFALAQLPLGVALDRYGPRLVQGLLFFVAGAGALIFAYAEGADWLFAGRALIGLGVSGGLVAGLKANAEFFPKERLPLVNGLFIASGASGAIVATTPAEWLMAQIDWRGLFQLLAGASALVACLILWVAPHFQVKAGASTPKLSFRAIYSDSCFMRLAPLSASCIGTAWALQGLWAAPWLTDVADLSRASVVHHLFMMAVALSLGALLMGLIADVLGRRGIGPEKMLIGMALLLISAEAALALRVPMPPIIAWSVIAAAGAMTVLSFSILGKYFPKEAAGRANAALNILHIGGAFAFQSAIGLIVGCWNRNSLGHYPPDAYSTALIILALLQFCFLLVFVVRKDVSAQPTQTYLVGRCNIDGNPR